MLLIRTFLKEIAPREIGLFAGEDLPKPGTLVWRFDARFDKTYSRADVHEMPVVFREPFLQYAYLDIRLGLYVLCGDDAKFLLHSETPNTDGRYKVITANGGVDFGTAVTNRPIKAGDQLTSDWREFDADFDRKMAALRVVPRLEKRK